MDTTHTESLIRANHLRIERESLHARPQHEPSKLRIHVDLQGVNPESIYRELVIEASNAPVVTNLKEPASKEVVFRLTDNEGRETILEAQSYRVHLDHLMPGKDTEHHANRAVFEQGSTLTRLNIPYAMSLLHSEVIPTLTGNGLHAQKISYELGKLMSLVSDEEAQLVNRDSQSQRVALELSVKALDGALDAVARKHADVTHGAGGSAGVVIDTNGLRADPAAESPVFVASEPPAARQDPSRPPEGEMGEVSIRIPENEWKEPVPEQWASAYKAEKITINEPKRGGEFDCSRRLITVHDIEALGLKRIEVRFKQFGDPKERNGLYLVTMIPLEGKIYNTSFEAKAGVIDDENQHALHEWLQTHGAAKSSSIVPKVLEILNGKTELSAMSFEQLQHQINAALELANKPDPRVAKTERIERLAQEREAREAGRKK